MAAQAFDAIAGKLLALVPGDGRAVGNKALRDALADTLDPAPTAEQYNAIRDQLVAQGYLKKAKGRGGAVKRAEPPDTKFTLVPLETPSAPPRTKRAGKKTGRKKSSDTHKNVISYRHDDRRVNNPEVGMVTPDTDPPSPKTAWAYDPHIAPALQFDVGRARIETLIDDALTSGDAQTMRDALLELKRQQAPYLNWSGKAERGSFEVDTVSLHVHERIDPASVLATVRKRLKDKDHDKKDGGSDAWRQMDLLAAPFENLSLRHALDFYKHDKGWSNRLIAGDSLQIMNSLLQKESMAGQVQMIYIDPPYGIKYGSNFQPFVNKRDVKDRNDQDLTAEPEMIKAFRDTWELGIHSYLTYLRDRLLLARELLSESGSVFVQISDENLHLARNLVSEIFDEGNFCGVITFTKTGGQSDDELAGVADYLLWYAKNSGQLKYRPLYFDKTFDAKGGKKYNQVRMQDGSRRLLSEFDSATEITGRIYRKDTITSQRPPGDFPVSFNGRDFRPAPNYWKTGEVGFNRLRPANRLVIEGQKLAYIRFIDDFPVQGITNVWSDVGGIQSRSDPKVYAVQTSTSVVQRCLLLTTDPGDLVLDPTCGSGTTAVVAEKWGRRWITCDTSRVAVTLAKQRLMTANYDYYDLKYPHEGVKSGFIYKSVPHITLKSIANNPEIDEIYERRHPAIASSLERLNSVLQQQAEDLHYKAPEGGRKGQTIDFRANGQTQEMPSGETVAVNALLEWEVPFAFPDNWPDAARDAFDAFHEARRAMQKAMDASIAAHADQETLYDQPRVAKDKLRITGPFSVEAVPFPTVLSLDEAEQPTQADAAIARCGETARQHEWKDELVKTGIKGQSGDHFRLAELETLPDSRYLHAIGTTAETGERVAVSFGPEHAALEQRQVENALREAEKLRPAPKFLVFAAFTFDPEAAKDIDQLHWPGVTLLKAQMNTDLLTEDLKKKRASNESFWLMGQPDVALRKTGDGQYQIEVNGFDYFDSRHGELVSGGKGKIALWLLDTDYDERSLFPQQIFFPMAGNKDGWYKLKKTIRAELDEDKLKAFHGTVSLPFVAGDNRKAAVKIVDDRGIESLKIIELD
ncbi:MAG: site-specific DNA-methyltransferase [Salinisphaera sp.]|nr:site-specific DNA-methyltransferase [Salinisphaera sp.]